MLLFVRVSALSNFTWTVPSTHKELVTPVLECVGVTLHVKYERFVVPEVRRLHLVLNPCFASRDHLQK